MRPLTTTVALCLLLTAGSYSYAAESVHPTGSGLSASYTLSGATLPAGDTLTVTRVLTNNAAFPLTGLYLSEHLPSGVQIISATVTVNNVPITPSTSSLPSGAVVTACTSHYWTISQPGVTALPAGQTLRLVIKLTGALPGQYTLPLHTIACMGNSNPYFATGDPVAVTITQPVDTTPPSAIGDLHTQ